MVPLLGFTPDIEATTPGTVVDCSQFVPSVKGMKAAPSNVATSFPALSAAAQGAALLVRLDGSVRFFVGTVSQISEGVAGAWSNVSRGLGYSVGGNRWRFAQFGNDSVAANKSCVLQRSTGASFADLVAPKASFCETVAGFVILADCNDAGTGLATGFGDQSDRWWCCGINDVTTWTPSLATQCASGRLVDAPGPLRGLRRLGPNVAAYKDKSIFLGTYVGAQSGVWRFDLIPGDIGCASHEAVVNIGTAHLFPGDDDFYSFDGSRPVSIGSPVRQWFFSSLDKSLRYKIAGMYDKANGLVWWFYPSTASGGALDSAIVYDPRSNRWGTADRDVELPIEIVLDGITYDNLGALFSTYDDLPAIPYDSPFWIANSPIPAVIGTDHKPYTLAGTPGQWMFKTGLFGDDQAVQLVTRVNPRWVTRPPEARMTSLYTMDEGLMTTTGVPIAMSANSGRFDVLRAARWHAFKFDGSGSAEIVGITITAQDGGSE